MVQTEQSEIPEVYQDAMKRALWRLEDAAAIAIIVGIDREQFIEIAGSAFDFMKQWHDQDKSKMT